MKSKKVLSYCGLICQSCPIFLSTQELNGKKKQKMREEILKTCNNQYNMHLKIDDITDCEGCKGNGRLFSQCTKCEIRKCAIEKGLKNCAFCSEYTCENLKIFFTNDPQAKINLEIIRSSL